jgi:hypothetical protein
VVCRTVLELPAGDCLLKHFDKTFEPTHDIRQLLRDDFAQPYFENSAWYEGYPAKSRRTFNCCTFAVAPFIGLTPDDFLDNHPTQGYPNPMQVVLDSYFERIRAYSPSAALAEFPHDAELRQDDVVCTVKTSGILGFRHAARVHVGNDQNLLLSKFGQGPILLADLPFTLRCFPGDEVWVYRYRGPRDALPSSNP